MKIDPHGTSSVTAETVQAKAEARLLLEENGRLRVALHSIASTALMERGVVPAPSVVWALANTMKKTAAAALEGKE